MNASAAPPLHEKNGLRSYKGRLAFTLANRCINNVHSDSILLHIILEFGEIFDLRKLPR